MKILLLMITHFLGYFVLQNQRTLQSRFEKPIYLLRHCIIYSVAFLVPFIFFGPILNAVVTFLILVFTHAVIDISLLLVKRYANGKFKTNRTTGLSIFVISQVFHISIILVLSNFLGEPNGTGVNLIEFLNRHLTTNHLYIITVQALLYTICLTPAAEFIREFLILFPGSTHETECETTDNHNNSGYIIGILERIIILMLGLSSQIGAIGFVLAAKSLARFKQLENRDFAEKYLLGTLLSVVISLACIVIGNNLLLK